MGPNLDPYYSAGWSYVHVATGSSTKFVSRGDSPIKDGGNDDKSFNNNGGCSSTSSYHHFYIAKGMLVQAK